MAQHRKRTECRRRRKPYLNGGGQSEPRWITVASYCCVLLLLASSSSSSSSSATFCTAFTPSNHHQQQHSPILTLRNPRKTSSSKTALNVIFTRLSDECLRAMEVAQDQAIAFQKSQVGIPFLLLGICENPGTARSTMEHYKIESKSIIRAMKYLDPKQRQKKSTPKLSDFNMNKDNAVVEIPYSQQLQNTLYQAGSIAKTMGSTAIHSEHVMLALLEYKEDGNGDFVAASRDGDNEAMELLWHLDATLEGDDVCLYLLQELVKERDRPKLAVAEPVQMKKRKTNKKDAVGVGSPNIDETVAGLTETATARSDESENPSFLQRCGVDMTQQAKDGDLDVVYGREEELQNCLRIMARRRKNNVCLIGEAGVGKTAIAEGLAQLLVSDKCPVILKGRRMITLEVAALLAGTKYRGEFEERFRAVIEELTQENSRSTILFLDEIHTLIGAGSSGEGGMDAANMLKPYLARGKLQLIGATTITEYNRFISKDPALERRLQPVVVKEPSVDQTIGILQALIPFYSGHHRVEFTPESLEAAAKLSDRYINDRFLPDKAIDVIDEAGALATLARVPNEPAPVVDEKAITNVISEWSNIPVGKLEMDEMSRLQGLEANLSRRVKGQERAVRSVAKAIRRARTGIRNPKRPIASFLFCGPTGTGKTELCKTLAETYFGSERDLIRIDCSEYMEKHSVSRLTGPPPGYAGYEEGGQLTESVRRAPHSVVLFDEMEKAHGDVLNLLLQVMEDGILTDGKGRTVSFKNAVLIMTSNIGSKKVLKLVKNDKEKADPDEGRRQEQSESSDKSLYSKLIGSVKRELESAMRPEFLNRIDDIIIFQPLSEKELSLIAALMVVEITARTKYERNVDISISRPLLQQMVNEGSSAASKFGARPMRRAVQRILEDAISEAVVRSFLLDSDDAVFGLKESTDPEVPYYVTVTRARDNETIDIEMEESTRDSLSNESSEADDEADDDDAGGINGDESSADGSSTASNMEHAAPDF